MSAATIGSYDDESETDEKHHCRMFLVIEEYMKMKFFLFTIFKDLTFKIVCC